MEAINDAPLMLSVSGARGLVGRTMNERVAARFARGFARHVIESRGIERPVFCLGRDSRRSGTSLLDAAAAGIVSAGGRIVDLGLAATPTVGVMVSERQAAGGVVITASHNPLPWNGLKCIDGNGGAPPAEVAAAIIARFHEEPEADIAEPPQGEVEQVGDAATRHVTRVLEHVDPDPIRAAGLTVVLDSVNGAGGPAGRMLLEQLGCRLHAINDEPTGVFAHTPEPLEANLGELIATTPQRGAAVGFAQDPDADRLAIVDERGRYIGEEYTLVLASQRVLQLGGPGVLATNLSTSRMLDDLSARYPGSRVVRTPVGEANVVAAMEQHGAVAGGEGNGGVIYPRVTLIRDSMSAMALVLSLMAAEAAPLSEIVDRLPRYAMVKHKLAVPIAGRDSVIEAATTRIAAHYAGERIDRSDGIRVDRADGWVHFRPSNTEPIVRIIAEAETADDAERLVRDVAGVAGVGP